MDWSEVNEVAFSPTGVAIHNVQRFVNYASATLAWFAIAWMYDIQDQNKREASLN